jgi:hypothetical protein
VCLLLDNVVILQSLWPVAKVVRRLQRASASPARSINRQRAWRELSTDRTEKLRCPMTAAKPGSGPPALDQAYSWIASRPTLQIKPNHGDGCLPLRRLD